ncbi:MAG TPA: type IV secretion system protein [Allosphingosinicella sp.]|nr:type IV secretion system protein [Allosphingosinicella sp.]
MNGCAPLSPGAGFIQSVLAFLDCQAQVLGSRGWQALAAPGSTLAILLMGFLTLFVALFGYRLLLGQGPDVRTGVVAFVKIGIVFALATSWGAYSTLVYDVVNRGPAEMAATIGGPSRLPGTGGDLVARLDGADKAFVALSVLGEGRPPPMVLDGNQSAGPLDIPTPAYSGSYAIGLSRMLFLIAAIAGLGAVRLVAGLLLAVGPFFIAFLLFDNTRSLFEGWVRALAGAALAALGVSIALAVELALIEPWLTDLLARRSAAEWLPGMPIELLVVTFSFVLIVLAMLYGAAKTASAFRLAPLWQAVAAQAGRDPAREERRFAVSGATARGDSPPSEARSRAATVVDAVAATQRRESSNIAAAVARGSGGGGETPGAQPTAAAAVTGGRASPTSLAPAPLGQSFPRRTRGRVSASAGRRDHRS